MTRSKANIQPDPVVEDDQVEETVTEPIGDEPGPEPEVDVPPTVQAVQGAVYAVWDTEHERFVGPTYSDQTGGDAARPLAEAAAEKRTADTGRVHEIREV